MKNSNTDNNSEIESSNYLVTEGVDPKRLDPIKTGMDLSLLSEAEEKQSYQPTVTKGMENSKIKKAISSLRLSNPFRGI